MIKFATSKEDFELIRRIVIRAMSFKIKGYKQQTCLMDIEACHCNGTPLRLSELLAADDFNFMHDIVGIANHINRQTGKLERCFLPRFAK